jgi:hypothetical protein
MEMIKAQKASLKEMIDKISTAKFYPTDHLSKGL